MSIKELEKEVSNLEKTLLKAEAGHMGGMKRMAFPKDDRKRMDLSKLRRNIAIIKTIINEKENEPKRNK